jgi:hypothetical protein
VDRELGGVFEIGGLASVTLSVYRSRLAPVLAGGPADMVVYFGLRPSRAARLAASAVTPAMNMSTPNS